MRHLQWKGMGPVNGGFKIEMQKCEAYDFTISQQFSLKLHII